MNNLIEVTDNTTRWGDSPVKTKPFEPTEPMESILGRLEKKISDCQPLKNLPPVENEKKAAQIKTLRENWNAPKRHAQTNSKFEGEWGSRFRQLKSKLGSHCIIALIGKRGVGKTQLAVELMRESTFNLRSAYFVTATDFFIRIKSTYKPNAAETEEQILHLFQKFKLLVIDEIGKRLGNQSEKSSAWEDNLLFELINRRYNDMTDTILIDNNDAPEFAASIGDSLIRRINETGGILKF